MINAPTAKALLEIKQSANVVIWDYQSYFEITIDGKEIAPQRMTNPPTARKFKTLAAAHSYLRNVLEYEGGIMFTKQKPSILSPYPHRPLSY